MNNEPPQCPLCDAPTHLQDGCFGKFWGCTKFPDCRRKVWKRGSVDIPQEIVPVKDRVDLIKRQRDYWKDKFFQERKFWMETMRNYPGVTPPEVREPQ